MSTNHVIITECPRDAMQGLTMFIPTEDKIRYLNQLLRAGFDYLDFGSFVNPKVMPQMADTDEVVRNLDWEASRSKLLAIIGNLKGAERAEQYPQIKVLGFPFSVSPTFLQRNINASLADTVLRIGEIKEVCDRSGKELLVYISMAFGNPYGDEWNTEIVGEWVERLAWIGINSIALSDTIGSANPESIDYIFSFVISQFPNVSFGAHFHTTPTNWKTNIDAAFKAGCRRFDAAIRGFGGCPMAKDELTGNLATENLIAFLNENQAEYTMNTVEFSRAYQLALEIFPK
ncbi:MAG: hydroxymethylglutaryl-CoA lyase [Flavobacteriales bacterium]|nr:hydroxymethylglutaryl-CoA lyase [Flavobacteriales bacterium]